MRHKIIFVFICISFCFECYSQKKVTIEPHIILQYDKGHLVSKSLGDRSFKSPIPSLSLYLGFLMEYLYEENKGFIIAYDGTAAQSSFRTTLNGNTCKIVYTHQIEMNLSQLSLGYSQYQKDKVVLSKLFKNSNISLRTKFSLGFGMTKNKPQSEYDNYFTKTYISNCATDTLQYSYITKIDSKFNFSIWFGYNLKFLLKSKEILSIGLYYNKGFLNQFKSDLTYKLNNNTYAAILGSRASNINLKIGFPISLKRWK